jgi:tRNA-dihydrouridine synthase
MFPHIEFLINGGFTEISAMQEILQDKNKLTGCMIGRMAMNNTWEIAAMDKTFYSD